MVVAVLVAHSLFFDDHSVLKVVKWDLGLGLHSLVMPALQAHYFEVSLEMFVVVTLMNLISVVLGSWLHLLVSWYDNPYLRHIVAEVEVEEVVELPAAHIAVLVV